MDPAVAMADVLGKKINTPSGPVRKNWVPVKKKKLVHVILKVTHISALKKKLFSLQEHVQVHLYDPVHYRLSEVYMYVFSVLVSQSQSCLPACLGNRLIQRVVRVPSCCFCSHHWHSIKKDTLQSISVMWSSVLGDSKDFHLLGADSKRERSSGLRVCSRVFLLRNCCR